MILIKEIGCFLVDERSLCLERKRTETKKRNQSKMRKAKRVHSIFGSPSASAPVQKYKRTIHILHGNSVSVFLFLTKYSRIIFIHALLHFFLYISIGESTWDYRKISKRGSSFWFQLLTYCCCATRGICADIIGHLLS